MAFRFCKACGGRYQTVTTSGQLYFHVCPTQILVTVDRAGLIVELPIQLLQAGDVEKSRRDVVRAGAVNENVIGGGDDQGQPIAAGAGALEAEDAAALDALVAAAVDQGQLAPVVAASVALARQATPVAVEGLSPAALAPAAGGGS